MERKNKFKRKLYMIGVIIIIITALSIPFVFATQGNSNMQVKQFFSVDNNEKTAGSTLEMTINLDCINYDNFIFTLTDVSNLSNIDIDTIQENIEVEKENNAMMITGNKTNMNMQEIKLYYMIPQELEVGAIFTLKAEIAENSEVDNNMQTNEILDVNAIGDNMADGKNTKQTIEITITIVEETHEGNGKKEQIQTKQDTGNQMNQGQIDMLDNSSNERQSTEKNSSLIEVQTTSSNMKNTSLSTGAQGETVTYNGSSNNYLKTLEIDVMKADK